MLGGPLDVCPRVEDERIATAIELAISAQYDTLPRSVFLTYLTIVDSLAIRGDRPLNTQEWLAKTIEESLQLNDQGLTTSLCQLKQESHGSAVRELVQRAGSAMGEDISKIKERQQVATKLYRVRSGLSHNRNATLTSTHIEDARKLVTFIIDAAIQSPAVLDRVNTAESSTENMALEKWDARFLQIAKIAATWSKDPKAQVGAVVVDQQGQVAGVGYNGFPKLVEDSAERYGDVDTKLEMVVHAEENAILGAGTRARGGTIYVSGKPICARCAGSVIQSGLRRAVAQEPKEGSCSKWDKSGQIARQMMEEAKIEFVPISK